MDECDEAPAWLAGNLEQTLTVRGATLSRIFLRRASELSDGGDAELSSLAAPWWAAALINGAGVRPQPAVWLISAREQGAEIRIWAADAGAHRYSNATWNGHAISGTGLQEVRDCVGPAPEP